jgi:hypothetical protein
VVDLVVDTNVLVALLVLVAVALEDVTVLLVLLGLPILVEVAVAVVRMVTDIQVEQVDLVLFLYTIPYKRIN